MNREIWLVVSLAIMMAVVLIASLLVDQSVQGFEDLITSFDLGVL